MGPIELEVYVELFRVTAWRDGCVYKTESLGYDWFPEATVKANRPSETNPYTYAAASTQVAMNQQTIRKART